MPRSPLLDWNRVLPTPTIWSNTRSLEHAGDCADSSCKTDNQGKRHSKLPYAVRPLPPGLANGQEGTVAQVLRSSVVDFSLAVLARIANHGHCSWRKLMNDSLREDTAVRVQDSDDPTTVLARDSLERLCRLSTAGATEKGKWPRAVRLADTQPLHNPVKTLKT